MSVFATLPWNIYTCSAKPQSGHKQGDTPQGNMPLGSMPLGNMS